MDCSKIVSYFKLPERLSADVLHLLTNNHKIWENRGTKCMHEAQDTFST